MADHPSAETIKREEILVAAARYVPNRQFLCIPFRSEPIAATSGLSQVDYGAENGAGKRWV